MVLNFLLSLPDPSVLRPYRREGSGTAFEYGPVEPFESMTVIKVCCQSNKRLDYIDSSWGSVNHPNEPNTVADTDQTER